MELIYPRDSECLIPRLEFHARFAKPRDEVLRIPRAWAIPKNRALHVRALALWSAFPGRRAFKEDGSGVHA